MVSFGGLFLIAPSLRPNRARTAGLGLASLCLIFSHQAFGQAVPPVLPKFSHLFVHYADQRSILERALNLVGMTGADVGRSFALIAGASHYPRLPVGSRELHPAEVDRDHLISYLKNQEFFDEVVVLWDDEMNEETLSYFLKNYFPKRLSAFPKSRFLFAYSGHGLTDGEEGYLLRSSATSFMDKNSVIDLRSVRSWFDETARAGYQSLVLLNSCYGGAFLVNRSFGGRYLPKHPGAHAITAGAADERTWSDSRIGPGSVFFESVFSGLGGAADRFPDGGDGVVTASELYAYLRQQVQISTDQRQSPQLGDLSVRQSEGEFFFLNRSRQVRAKLVPDWNPMSTSAGSGFEATPATVDPTRLVLLSGNIPIGGTTLQMDLSGSFGQHQIEAAGGKLKVELSLSSSNARFEQIELRTPFITRTFSGQFSPGFNKPPIRVEVSLSFFVIVSTSRPSPQLTLLPLDGGGFRLDPFYTSACDFSCYQLEIIGAWTARGPDISAMGYIRSALTGRGVGADMVAELDPTNFPSSIQLKNVAWHANSGGTAIPDLVNADIDGVHVRVSTNRVEFPGVRNADVILTTPQDR